MTPAEIKDGDRTHAHVNIISSEGTAADVFINGQKVPGVIGYEIMHDRTKTQVPILRLNVQCHELRIDSHMIPEVPEPWSLLYDFTWKHYGSVQTGNPEGGWKQPCNPDCSQDSHNDNQ